MHRLVFLLLPLLAVPSLRADPSDIRSGLCVVLPASDAKDLIRRSMEGRVLVHGLTPDPQAAARLRAELREAGAYGLVSILVWNGLPALPYAEDLVNQFVLDADALPTPPSAAELERVLVPRWGFAQVRKGGAWTRHAKPLPAGYGEWTHYFHDHTNNPVSRDQGGIATGIRWITGPSADGGNHSYFGSGKLVDVSITRRAITGAFLTTREAFNGLPVWRKAQGDMKQFSTRRYEPNILHGNRLIRLRTRQGPLVGLSLDSGEEEVIYDALPIQDVPPKQSIFVAATADGAVGTMAIVHENVLYAASGDKLAAMDPDNGKLLWMWTSPEGGYFGYPVVDDHSGVLAVCIGDKATGSSRNTAFIATRILGFDRKKGVPLWSVANPIPSHVSLMCAYEGGLYLQSAAHLGSDKVSLLALDAATGARRWFHEERQMSGVGRIMVYPGRLYGSGSELHAFDLADGTPLGSWPLGNSRCDQPRGSARFINNFGHFLDVTELNRVTWDRAEITRNSCGGASIPAYGLRYSTDNRCSCFDAVRGRVAQGSTPVPPPTPDAERLLRGPAFARPLGSETQGWTALLGSVRRTSAAGPLRQNAPAKRWQTVVSQPTERGPIPTEWRDGDNWNGPITSPTVADGRVYVAETVGHALVCLNADDGKILWRFPVDARIDGPPTLARGRVVFGSRDGHVYCLDAADGQLVWRFQAAAAHRWIPAFGQLESVWPLRGSLPVIDGLVLASAGYHPEADGGIQLWALNLADGAVRWKRVLGADRPTVEFPLVAGAGRSKIDTETFNAIFRPNRVTNMEIVANGKVFKLGSAVMFVADGTDAPRDHPDLYLLPSWNTFAMPHRRPLDYNPHGPGGYSGVWGQVGSKLFGFTGERRNGKPGVPGRPIAMDEHRIVIQSANPKLGTLWCFAKTAAADGSPPLWRIHDRERADRRGDVAPNSLLIAGETAVMTSTRFNQNLSRTENGPLEIRSMADGSLLHREELPSTTVDHGLAAHDGRLFLSLVDGSVMCME